MREFYERSLKGAEDSLLYFDRHTVKDKNNTYNGLFPFGNMLFEDGTDIWSCEIKAILYTNPDSKYYKDEKMLDDIIEICPLIDKHIINEDGTTNQMTSNFHSPSIFVLGRVAEVCIELHDKLQGTEKERKALESMVHIARRYADGCLNSGFHTPNHRWAETGSLLMAYKLLGDERLKEKADKYIAEGIDIDEYGEYSERSAGMYNQIMDCALLTAYNSGYLPEALDAVHKNLRLMEYYTDDGNDVFSQNSRRTDKGERGTVAGFYKGAQYHLMQYYLDFIETAYLTGDLYLVALAKRSEEVSIRSGLGVLKDIFLFLRHPGLKDWEPDISGIKLLGDYEHYQPKSNIVRKRTGDAVCSILANNPSFVFLRNAGIDVNIRMCASFFAIGQFIPSTMEKTETGYRMRCHADCDYKLPFDVPPANSREYWTMDYKSRKGISKQNLDYTVDFVFVDGGLDMHIVAEHCDGVPLKVEFGINGGLLLETGDSASMITKAGGMVFARRGFRAVNLSTLSFVSVEGMGCRHLYAENMRGAEADQTDRQSVYFTDYTPVDKVIKIRYGILDGSLNYYNG